ncbi:retron St85 family effector protein [Roseococcus sp. SDR]|uniref:retron St85 family effector protein n=1 Tax=Roseococcus sp. SDR TaxID=2835532 RepID=UPI001BCDBB77|nr:retron St85 family effector protein [Roseococcus sp. SDR]MBV1845973.1 retron St85 family effector protein [Roseococcus sp. SDR]
MTSIRVYVPTKIFLVCGGPRLTENGTPSNWRDAFLRIAKFVDQPDIDVQIPEDCSIFPPHGHYQDWLTFETDFAHLCEAILLFVESAGSIAELGAFSAIPPIAERLLVVIDYKYFNHDSFIRRGPVEYLRKMHGDHSVISLSKTDVGCLTEASFHDIDLNMLYDAIIPNASIVLEKSRLKTTFDKSNIGHLILLMIGLIQHYGALKFDEISELVNCITDSCYSREKIRQYLCAGECAGWIVSSVRGTSEYFGSRITKKCWNFEVTGEHINRERWRTDIIDHWKTKESSRFNFIRSMAGA